MRENLEIRERQQLSPLAIQSAESKGRQYPEDLDPNRTCFQRDRDRIIHSKAFRRLTHKTQVFIALESDHYRSRLTHSLEVAQISRQIARRLCANEDLCEGVSLSHDLGHTPFGHSGEEALNEKMQPFGGFEHNQQSLRIVEKLEHKYPQFPGLNLSYELKEALKKHQTPWDHPRAETSFRSIEAEIVNLADEISYNNHDIDDGLSSGILDEKELEANVTLWREAKHYLMARYTDLSESELKYLINSMIISDQISDLVVTTEKQVSALSLQSVDDIQATDQPIVLFSDEMREKSNQLRCYLWDHLYTHSSIVSKNKNGQAIIQALFDLYMADPSLMPPYHQMRIEGSEGVARVCCDYVAGMTDTFASKEFKQC